MKLIALTVTSPWRKDVAMRRWVMLVWNMYVMLWICLFFLGIMSPVAVAETEKLRPVKLGEGRNGKYLWGATMSRSSSKQGGQSPCVNVSLRDLKPKVSPERNFDSFDQVCSSLALAVGPNIVLSSRGHGANAFTIGALAVSPRIEAVRLELGAAGSRVLKTSLLNPQQKRNSGLRSARYATFVIRGPFCLGAVVGYDNLGAEIYERPSEGCGGRVDRSALTWTIHRLRRNYLLGTKTSGSFHDSPGRSPIHRTFRAALLGN